MIRQSVLLFKRNILKTQITVGSLILFEVGSGYLKQAYNFLCLLH